MNKCPFKIGDKIVYEPSKRGHSLDDADLLEIGKIYRVERLEKDDYVVIEGYGHPGGGIYWTEFKKYNRKMPFEYVGFGKRFLAYLIDCVVLLPLYFLTRFALAYSFHHRTIIPQVVLQTLMISFWVFMTVKYGGTPGKLFVRIRIVDSDGNFLSIPAAICRTLLWLIGNLLSNLQMYHVLNVVPAFNGLHNFHDMMHQVVLYGGAYQQFITFWSFLIFIDVMVILFDYKNRAVHDFLAGSFVVTKESLEGQVPSLLLTGSVMSSLFKAWESLRVRQPKAETMLVLCPLFGLLLYASYIDFLTYTIHDSILVLPILYFLLIRLFVRVDSYFSYIFGFFVIPLICVVVDIFLKSFSFYQLHFSEAFLVGGGDIKLFAVIGIALGFYTVLKIFGVFLLLVSVAYCIASFLGFTALPAGWAILLAALLVFSFKVLKHKTSD